MRAVIAITISIIIWVVIISTIIWVVPVSSPPTAMPSPMTAPTVSSPAAMSAPTTSSYFRNEAIVFGEVGQF